MINNYIDIDGGIVTDRNDEDHDDVKVCGARLISSSDGGKKETKH